MKLKYKELTISFGFSHLESIKILQFLQKKENNVIKFKCQFSTQAKTKVNSDNFENI